MKRTMCVHMSAPTARFTVVSLNALAAAVLLCSSGCATKTEDYGWFSYAAPEGWKRLDLSSDGSNIAFRPGVAVRDTGVRMVEFSQVDWLKRIKKGEFADAVIKDLKMHWEHDSKQAELQGESPPPFVCNEIPSNIKGPGQIKSYSIQKITNGRPLHFLKHFIELPDGRRFIVEYSGYDPGYSQQLAVVKKSLKTIRFADAK